MNFKRANNRKWRGPGKVLGQDGQQILAKYGNDYLRVHPLYHWRKANLTNQILNKLFPQNAITLMKSITSIQKIIPTAVTHSMILS